MIDWARVGELRAEIGDEGFAEVVELFLDEVEDVVARLRAVPDPASYEEDLHFLKGSAWNLGFSAFGALCQDGERRAAGGQAGGIDIPAILDSYERSKDVFIDGLGELAAGREPSAA
ncbi:Hpt domain-containing protein [Frigidibacter sp. SD6-1]|uniref:Hpt domain-containing protein n=1 Tax=Frigidibacter sp. SD6-1 TaxID=3032581 RepID=UPI0024E03F98|nr:Hpt domain-containing protein [Frigidibacter sp. SD6-1]